MLWCDVAQGEVGVAGVVPVDPGGGFAFDLAALGPGLVALLGPGLVALLGPAPSLLVKPRATPIAKISGMFAYTPPFQPVASSAATSAAGTRKNTAGIRYSSIQHTLCDIAVTLSHCQHRAL